MTATSATDVTEDLSETMLQILPRKYCCSLSQHSRRVITVLGELDELSELQKATVIARFISITEDLKKRMLFYAYCFHVGRITVTAGSLVVPALLSIQTPTGMTVPMFWLTWGISLAVTISNAVLTLFKVEKKYYYIHTCVEQLYSEVWQYIGLTGKYGGHLLKDVSGAFPTHANQYIFLLHAIERTKLKQIEEEYFKVLDSQAQNPTPVATGLPSGEKPDFGSPTPSFLMAMKRAKSEALSKTSGTDAV